MKNQTLAPVALFVYNRLEHTIRTIEALKKNAGSDKTDLIIFSDGPKTPAAQDAVNQVRSYIKSIDGFKSVEIFPKESNSGLAKSIIEGVTYMMDKYGQAIILEDDLITSPHFLNYMNEALDLYRNDEKVISIHGYVYPTKETLPETFFIRGADCWGWATWERAWKYFEPDGSKLLANLESQSLQKQFNLDNSYNYVGMLKDQIAGKVSSWAIRWNASAFLANKLTLYPGRSLVENIGFDGSGTHCDASGEYKATVTEKPIQLLRIDLNEDQAAKKAFARYFRSTQPSILQRVSSKVSALLKKIS